MLSLNYWLYFRLLFALPSRCDFPFCNNILPKILAMQTEEVGNKQGGQGEAKNALQAGRQLAGGYCGVLWGLISDLDYLVAILKLPNFNSSRPCSLCRCSLSGANSWNDFSPEANWRNQLWTLSAWKAWAGRSRCPLFKLSYCSSLTIHLDFMHCKYLGVDQYTYASVLALLTCSILPDSPQQNLNVLWRMIKQYYQVNGAKFQYRYMNKLTIFLRKNGAPKLRGKAGEIRHFAPVILHLWTRFMSPDMEVHQKIKLLLKFWVQMEELITENREELAFPANDAQKFANACENMLTLHASLANHFAEEGTDLFTLTSKCHMLQLIALLARCVSPRLDTCLTTTPTTSLPQSFFLN